MSGPQLSRSDLRRLTPEQIATARREGRLADLLAGHSPPDAIPADPGVPQLTRADLADMTSEQIVKARRAGQLAEVLGGLAPIALDFSGYP